MVNFRSNCPVSTALDLLGDKWSLLIVRDMLIFHKSTFKDFESSNEKIATNILSKRLKFLEESAILTKNKLKTNKKTNVYLLTAKGYELANVLVGLQGWSNKHLNDAHPQQHNYELGSNQGAINKTIESVITKYKNFTEQQLNLCWINS